MPLNPAFRVAVIAGAEESVHMHLKRGDDINARDISGATPLMLAASRNRPEIVKILLLHGADPTLVDSQGRDALAISKARIGNDCEEILSRARIAPSEPQISDDLDKVGCQSPDSRGESIGDISVGWNETWRGQGGDIDSPDEWEEEPPQSPPLDQDQVKLAANSVQMAIGRHVPVILDADWEDVDAFLPARADLDDQEADFISDTRRLLLQSAGSGYILESDVQSLCRRRSGTRDTEAERRLSIVVSDMEWVIGDMPILRDRVDTYEAMPHEMRAIEDALEFLEVLTHDIGKQIGLASSQLSNPVGTHSEVDTILLHYRAGEFLRCPPLEPSCFWIEESSLDDQHWFYQCASAPQQL